jgi:hypothetical protein
MLAPRESPPFKRMADGKTWTTRNLDVDVAPSYCYDDAEANCRHYGRLYTWESTTAWFYNLGRGSVAVNRHRAGEKLQAFAVRCING